MQKDEIWELKPEENDKKESGAGGAEPDPPESEEQPDAGQTADSAGSSPGQKPKKEPDRLDMDEILDLKPDSEETEKEPPEEKPAQDGSPQQGPSAEKDKLELVDIGETRPGAAEEQEGVVVARQEEKSISTEKPQVLEPDEGSTPKGGSAELQAGEFKKYERAPRVQGGAPLPQKSGLLTIGLLVVFLFLGASAAVLALPFFGIESLPEDMPVVGQIIDFYRNLPIFPG